MIVIIIIPLLIILLSITRLLHYRRKVKAYYKVRATVIGNKMEQVMAGDVAPYTYYSPVFKFTDKDGIERSLVYSEDNADKPVYNLGDSVTLLINPDDASRFIVYSIIDGYVISLIWFVVGVFVLLCVIFYKE